MLHLIAESSLSSVILDRVATGDDVILQANTVWAAYAGHQDNAKLLSLVERGCQVYALQDVLSSSGIAEEQLLPGVQALDYPAFVELTVKNKVIQTWS